MPAKPSHIWRPIPGGAECDCGIVMKRIFHGIWGRGADRATKKVYFPSKASIDNYAFATWEEPPCSRAPAPRRQGRAPSRQRLQQGSVPPKKR